MRGIIAYSKPRGVFGYDYVFTVVIDFDEAHEKVDISVTGNAGKYSCHICGQRGNIHLKSIENQLKGSLHFYRHDNVHAGDRLSIYLQDIDLVFAQFVSVSIGHKEVSLETDVDVPDELAGELPNPPYPFYLINWDEHMARKQGQPTTVEEELINKVMEGQKITIKELFLQPAKPHALVKGMPFIEGELKYIEEKK